MIRPGTPCYINSRVEDTCRDMIGRVCIVSGPPFQAQKYDVVITVYPITGLLPHWMYVAEQCLTPLTPPPDEARNVTCKEKQPESVIGR